MRLGACWQTSWLTHPFHRMWFLPFEALIVWLVHSQPHADQRPIHSHHFLVSSHVLKKKILLKKETESCSRSNDFNCRYMYVLPLKKKKKSSGKNASVCIAASLLSTCTMLKKSEERRCENSFSEMQMCTKMQIQIIDG